MERVDCKFMSSNFNLISPFAGRGSPQGFRSNRVIELERLTLHHQEAHVVKMAVADNVYLAKLAEQAERYEGKIQYPLSSFVSIADCQ